MNNRQRKELHFYLKDYALTDTSKSKPLGIHVKVMVIEDMLTWKFLVKWLDLY